MAKGTALVLVGLALGIMGLSSMPTEEPISYQIQKQDWTLEIPDINFSQVLSPAKITDNVIAPPDTGAGYLQNEGNILIIGHNLTTFKRLKELPNYINLRLDGQDKTYYLQKSETLPKESIRYKDGLLKYQGIVIITCAGTENNGTWSHRLVLYYK